MITILKKVVVALFRRPEGRDEELEKLLREEAAMVYEDPIDKLLREEEEFLKMSGKSA